MIMGNYIAKWGNKSFSSGRHKHLPAPKASVLVGDIKNRQYRIPLCWRTA
jgi:hypothetical protein